MYHDRGSPAPFFMIPLPTQTQLYRIRYTIDVLLEQQVWLAEQTESSLASAQDLIQSRYHHALELVSGWSDVQRLVDALPEKSFERLDLQDEIDQGIMGAHRLRDHYARHISQ
jgi:hypothetical protein